MRTSQVTAMLVSAAFIGSAVPALAAAPAASAATVGTVEMNGDAAFDSDTLADSSATQYRWHSFPGSRLSLNANPATDSKAPAGQLDSRLTLNAGGWFGTETVSLDDVVRAEVAPTGGSASAASSVSTTWYPYQLEMSAAYSSPAATVSGYDLMIDADSTIVRVLDVDAASSADLVLTGAANGSGGAQWIGSDDVVLVSDDDYFYAVHAVALNKPTLSAASLASSASISGGEWTWRTAVPASGTVGVSVGVAAASEGSAAAIDRATAAFDDPVIDTVADAKARTDDALGNVPAPSAWGLPAAGISAAEHRAVYYSAWTFLLQGVVDTLPENAASYPYPQVMAGKPSLWNFGSAGNPGTAQWESAFGYQMLSFVDPETAWQAYLGLLSEVDATGVIGGESLPTRLAQTAWVLYENSGDLAHLATAYSNLKRYLEWAGDNPRWVCCGYDITEEKNLNFISSWMFDTRFAVDIATELGLTADAAAWEDAREDMVAELEDWFFWEPDVIYGVSYQYTEIPKEWSIGNDLFKATALAISEMPAPLMDRMTEFYMSIHSPEEDLANFHYHKYPDINLILYGLLENGGHVQAEELATASLRDVIRGKQFGEALVPTPSGVRVDSVAPSNFTAAEAIELTWLLNGMRYDSGTPTTFSFGTSTLATPAAADALPVIESFNDVSDWNNTYNSFVSASGGSGMVRYEDVVGGAVGYGMAEKEVDYDVDENPMLTIKVAGLYGSGAQWALRVNDGSGDVSLQDPTAQLGELTYDLKAATDWTGSKTFSIRIYAVSGMVKVQELSTLTHALDTFDSAGAWAIDPWNATITTTGGIAKITTTSTYGQVKKSFTYDVDTHPDLKIKVPEVGGGSLWALKVNDGSGDISLQPDTATAGEFVYDLKGITGWSEMMTFDIVLYAIHEPGAYLMVDYLQAPTAVVENFADVSDWDVGPDATLSGSGGVGTLTSTGFGPAHADRTFTLDVSRYRKISVTVPSLGGGTWSASVDTGDGFVSLTAGSATTGMHTFDLASATGSSGATTFLLRLEVDGGTAASASFTDVRVADL